VEETMPPAIAAAAITAAGAIGSSLLAGHAASKAANAQSNAAQLGIDEQKREFDLSRGDLMPWLTAGQSSLGGMLDLLGLSGGDKQQAAITGLQNSPLFTSLYGQGKEAILQSASATGGLRGGNTEHSLFNLGSDLLAQVIQQQFSNLSGLSGQGLSAGGGLATLGQGYANSLSNLFGQQGAAQAGGTIGQAQGFGGALQGLTSFLNTPGLFGGGGGGGGIPTLPIDAFGTGNNAGLSTAGLGF
jgi:hypothetical protein